MSSSASSASAQLKQQGNAFYAEHKLGEAYRCYREASKLSPDEAIYIANQSAVLFEAGLYSACIETSDLALSKMSSNEAQVDSTGLRERLLLRKAKAAFFSQNFELAQSCLRDAPSTAGEEWKNLLRSCQSYREHQQRCSDSENSPLAFECSVPSLRGSLMPPFEHPISEDTPTSIFHPSTTNIDANLLTIGASEAENDKESKKNVNLLFAHTTDPRHLITSLKHAQQLLESQKDKKKADLVVHVLETNPKILARFVLMLFVMGHRDLDETRSRQASEFVYFLWIGLGLIPPHWTMLHETLHEICKLSYNLETWRLDAKSAWIKFGDEVDLKKVRDVWITWGSTTEEKEIAAKKLTEAIDLRRKSRDQPPQKKRSQLPSPLEQALRKSPECSRELDFFNENRLVLPRPPLLEGDKTLPPKSMHTWMLNPTIDVSDPSLCIKDGNNDWIFESRPDAIFPFGRSQPRQDLTPCSMYAASQIYDAILAIKSLKESSNLKIKFFCGQYTDMCDVGSRIGSIVRDESLKFDRIHSGSNSDVIGLFSTFLVSSMILSPRPTSAFYTPLGEHITIRGPLAHKYTYESLDHLLWNKLRLEKSHISSRLGMSVSPISSSTSTSSDQSSGILLLWQRNGIGKGENTRFSGKSGSNLDESELKDSFSFVDDLYKTEKAYKTEFVLQNVFSLCTIPAPSETSVLEPSSANMTSFLRFTTLLLQCGHPVHWVSQAIEKIISGEIKVALLDDPTQAHHAKKPTALATAPYVMELRTLSSILSRSLAPINFSSPLFPANINGCHWFQAENVAIHNYVPTRRLPTNPSVVALIVDKKISFEGKNSKLSLVERLSTTEGQSNYYQLLQQHAKDINVVSAVYWTGPSRIDEPSKVTFGFWLPEDFVAASQPPHNFSIVLFRLDIYLCIGISSLSSMTCTTAD